MAVAVGGNSLDVRLLGGVAIGGNSSGLGLRFTLLPLLHQVRDVGRLDSTMISRTRISRTKISRNVFFFFLDLRRLLAKTVPEK